MVAPHKKEIDWDKVELYLKAGAKQIKIAQSLFISEDTLRSRIKEKYGMDYAAFSASLHSTGELLLEAKQFQKAMEGNTHMLTWLGKVRLGQKEPDMVSLNPTNQLDIDKDHRIMQLEHENAQLRENVNQSKAE